MAPPGSLELRRIKTATRDRQKRGRRATMSVLTAVAGGNRPRSVAGRSATRKRKAYAHDLDYFKWPWCASIHFTLVEYPNWLLWWLWGTCLVCAYGILRAWWIPYLGTPDPERAKRYSIRFAGAHAFLPERNGIRPDTLHVAFHALVVAIGCSCVSQLHAPMNIMMSCAWNQPQPRVR